MSTSALDQYLKKLRKVIDYRPDEEMPSNLVVSSDSAQWIGAEVTHNPSRIGLLLSVPARSFELMLQEIPAGQASDMQRHTHESVHFVVEGSGYSEIGPRRVGWRKGDFVYTPVWVWHRHYNTGASNVRMLLTENSRMTDAIAVSRRESAGLITYAELQEKQAQSTLG